jgi:alkylation response protein AidB-like acyl-CoA dehydrogenase
MNSARRLLSPTVAVRLDDTEEEALLRNAFRSLFANHATPAHARAAEPALGYDPDLWKQLAAMDALTLSVALDDGGSGAHTTDLAIVAEEAGASIISVPLIEHLVAVRLLAAVDTERYRDAITGDALATVALRPARAGVWKAVAGGAVADVVVGIDGDDLVVVRNPTRVALENTGALSLADVEARSGEFSTIGHSQQLAPAADLWRVLTASSLVGIAGAALRIATSYVLERHQFGRAIGSYQAVQHGLADLPGLIAGARLLTGKAAWAHDQLGTGIVDVARNEITDARLLASMAFVFATEAAHASVDRALHYHGAIGCTLEADIQLFYRRSRSVPLAIGPIHAERRHLAHLLLDAS